MIAAITKKSLFFSPSCTQRERADMNVSCRAFQSILGSGYTNYGHGLACLLGACVNFTMVLMYQKILGENSDGIYHSYA